MRTEQVVATLMLISVSSIPMAANLPESLRPSPTDVLLLQSKATGVQIYTCVARRDDLSKYEWTLKAPEAELYDSSGKRIGKHYAGPTWESNDGSKVVGEVKARDNGPDSNAIPWLLLRAKSTSGNGIFTKATSIQRLDTIGGKAPPGGCDASLAGKELRVPYSATYIFFSAQ
jgi:hypothetical protein